MTMNMNEGSRCAVLTTAWSRQLVGYLSSFDNEKELAALFAEHRETMGGGPYRCSRQREQSSKDGVGKVLLLIGVDATVVVHEKDDLVQKDASAEE
ncbi:hypothetical protein BHE74_00036870 [Ensete ventricosum]|uniref:Uncharacterized protein n=1 Tax=Ensete ventricosum TaxID=4639 RepID=A0A444DUS6_ENSVE|nr:hypothetical protein GW17_00035058 [Ensete ventricosum]RWW56412.1 hypothetical protein BHE74_00036870 [Ensete ventricosum]RZR73453.1 hypothetical protein BHM03_00024498 [Ensete ventricosum]